MTDPTEVGALEELMAKVRIDLTDPAAELVECDSNRLRTALTILSTLAAENERLRKDLLWIYERAGKQLWKTRARGDEAGHHCLYRGALQAVKVRAKESLSARAALKPSEER